MRGGVGGGGARGGGAAGGSRVVAPQAGGPVAAFPRAGARHGSDARPVRRNAGRGRRRADADAASGMRLFLRQNNMLLLVRYVIACLDSFAAAQ